MLIDGTWYMPWLVTVDIRVQLYRYKCLTHSVWKLSSWVDMSQWVLLCLGVGELAA